MSCRVGANVSMYVCVHVHRLEGHGTPHSRAPLNESPSGNMHGHQHGASLQAAAPPKAEEEDLEISDVTQDGGKGSATADDASGGVDNGGPMNGDMDEPEAHTLFEHNGSFEGGLGDDGLLEGHPSFRVRPLSPAIVFSWNALAVRRLEAYKYEFQMAPLFCLLPVPTPSIPENLWCDWPILLPMNGCLDVGIKSLQLLLKC